MQTLDILRSDEDTDCSVDNDGERQSERSVVHCCDCCCGGHTAGLKWFAQQVTLSQVVGMMGVKTSKLDRGWLDDNNKDKLEKQHLSQYDVLVAAVAACRTLPAPPPGTGHQTLQPGESGAVIAAYCTAVLVASLHSRCCSCRFDGL